MLIPAGNLATSTLHKEPPAIRDTSTAHKGSSLMAGGGAMYLNFDTVKYHPIPLCAVKKMMRCNAASLMAGGGAVYLNFDTGSTQNIIKSLKSSAGAFTNSVGALMRGG